MISDGQGESEVILQILQLNLETLLASRAAEWEAGRWIGFQEGGELAGRSKAGKCNSSQVEWMAGKLR